MPINPLTMLCPYFIAFLEAMLTQVYLYGKPFVPKVVAARGTRTLNAIIFSYHFQLHPELKMHDSRTEWFDQSNH